MVMSSNYLTVELSPLPFVTSDIASKNIYEENEMFSGIRSGKIFHEHIGFHSLIPSSKPPLSTVGIFIANITQI